MKRWPVKKLGTLVDFVGGGTPRRDRSDYWDGPIPWASVKDLQSESLETTAETITSEGLKNSASNLIPAGTVIIASRVGLGKVAINQRPVAINQDLKALTPCSAELSSRYLLQFLRSKAEYFERIGVGATVKGLTIADYQKLDLPVPPMAEQERIVKLLDEADALRKLRAQADRRTTALLPALFDELFGDPLTNPNRWKLCSISEIAEVQGGLQLTQRRNELSLKSPYLRVANVQRGFLVLDEIKSIGLLESEFNRTKLIKGDLLLVEGNGNPKEVGRAAVWDGSIEDCVHQNHLIRVRPNTVSLTSEYLLAFVNSESGRSYFHGAGNTTSGLSTITTSIVKNCRIPVPPLALQQTFARRVAEIRELEAAQAASRRRLDALFLSLLHRAFAGEL